MTSNEIKTIQTDENEFMFDLEDEVNTKVVRCQTLLEPNNAFKISSSKIKLKNIVDYKWESKEYNGRLIAAHIGGELIAYSIKVNNGSGGNKNEGMIRVVNVENGQRCLIKGMTSEALDLEFAHVKSPVLLAYIEDTTMYVQKISDAGDKIVATLIFTLVDPLTEPVTSFKISWCPYIPESKFESDAYTSQLLVWSRNNVFQCYSINDLVWKLGSGPHKPEAITEESLVYKGLRHTISDIIFSPDGSILAVCTDEGLVQFFQIYLHSVEDTPRQLHEWNPHNGAKVNRIFFLDNLTEATSDESLWQFVITCAHHNTELKLWDCENWECLQTIKFELEPDSDLKLHFKAALDESASYLVLSDMNNLELFVLQLEKCVTPDTSSSPADSPSENNEKIVKAKLRSIAKFNLVSPILSFQVTDVAIKRMKNEELTDSYIADDYEDYEEENLITCVVLQMYSVQPKSVQRCQLLYQPIVKTPSIETNGTAVDLISSTEPVKDTQTISAKSSPSREVENILSFPKENDDVFDALFDTQTELEQIELEKDDDEEEKEDIVVEETEIITGDEAEADIPTEWPIAPTILPPLTLLNVQEEIRNVEILLNNHEENTPNDIVVDQLEKVTKILQQQSLEMAEMKSEMKQIMVQTKQREASQEAIMATLLDIHQKTQEELCKLSSRNVKKEKEVDAFEHLLEKFTTNCKVQMETTIKDSLTKQMERQISQILATKLDTILDKHHVKTNHDLIQQTQTNELLLKLNKNQMFNDALGKSISVQLKPVVETSVMNSVATSLIPAYENLTKELFHQIHKVFVSGMKEYTNLLEKHIKQLKYSEEQQQHIVNSTKILPDQIQKKMEDLKNINAAQISQIVNKDLKVIQTNLLKLVRDQIVVEIEKGFKEQASSLETSMLSVVRSQAQTPVPSVQDVQQKINSLLKQTRVNEAFHSALIANDLSLVEFTLEKADFGKVFNPCFLEQTVLLSLIQQLSADMRNHNDMKQKYLSEAVMNLDFRNTITKEHAPNILKELRHRCREFVKENTTSPLNSAVRMLMVASQGIENSP